MPINEKTTIVCDLVNAEIHSREYKLMIANTIMESIIQFLNQCITKFKLHIALLPRDYDPHHRSRWIYFFLRETVRNSIDACYSKPADRLEYISIEASLTTADGYLHLKIQDNGVGFLGIEPGMKFTEIPEHTKKDKEKMLGGKGFGLEICKGSLPSLLFKNEAAGGASVECSLGEGYACHMPAAS